jgi:hypothetical protein
MVAKIKKHRPERTAVFLAAPVRAVPGDVAARDGDA